MQLRRHFPAKKPHNPFPPKRKTLSGAFFGDSEKILVDEPGNSFAVLEEAMSRIEMIMVGAARYATGTEVEFSGNVRCSEEGHLSLFCYKTKGGTCYDGGCYSREPSEEKYCYFTRVTSAEFYREQDENEEWGKYWQNYWVSTWHTLRDDRTGEVFMKNRSCLYMENPLGVLGYFKLQV